MADLTAEQAQRAAQQRQREIERAFAVVFGLEGKRSIEQEIVWQNLLAAGFADRPIIRQPFDSLQIAADAANHDLIVRIRGLVKNGSTPDNPANFPGVGSIRDSE